MGFVVFMEKREIERVAEAIIIAKKESESVKSTVDRGSCNLDTVCISLKGWRKGDIDELSKKCGVGISERLSGYFSGYRFLHIETGGQADLRSAVMESAFKSLKKQGIDCVMWYQLD